MRFQKGEETSAVCMCMSFVLYAQDSYKTLSIVTIVSLASPIYYIHIDENIKLHTSGTSKLSDLNVALGGNTVVLMPAHALRRSKLGDLPYKGIDSTFRSIIYELLSLKTDYGSNRQAESQISPHMP